MAGLKQYRDQVTGYFIPLGGASHPRGSTLRGLVNKLPALDATRMSATRENAQDCAERPLPRKVPAMPDEAPVVLLIDNDPATISLLSLLVDHARGRVIAARNAADGLDRARSELPSLIVLDVHLPDMSGLELVERLREDARTRAIAVLVLTVDTSLATEIAMRQHDVTAYVTKPFDVPVFLALLERVLSTARAPGS